MESVCNTVSVTVSDVSATSLSAKRKEILEAVRKKLNSILRLKVSKTGQDITINNPGYANDLKTFYLTFTMFFARNFRFTK